MLHPSFKLKLTAAMLGLLTALTGSILWITQRHVAETYTDLFAERFEELNAASLALQEARLGSVKRRCADFAALVRLGALMRRLHEDREDPNARQETGSKLYTTARDELGDFMSSRSALMLAFSDAEGKLVPGGAWSADWSQVFSPILPTMMAGTPQQAGTLVTELPAHPLVEFVFARISDPVTGDALGGLLLVFPAPPPSPMDDGVDAWWAGGHLYAPQLSAAMHLALQTGIQNAADQGAAAQSFSVPGPLGGWQVHRRDMNQNTELPPAIHILAYARAPLLSAQARLARQIALFGGFGLLIASSLAAWVSHGLTVPLREIAKGTSDIQAGHYDTRVLVRSRDEVGQLAVAFNDMAAGLALKEKYRSVLDKVSDPGVAAALMQGDLVLGGERRQACVLFCDIRGFTPLTQDMDPADVIQMLNEHFTPLANLIARHHGVVDKYVGDLVMAVFGAPVSHEADTANALRCAVEMVQCRKALNALTDRPIFMGVGVAAGDMVAGCMGSDNRLNYTVLGERVNLAARLCSRAAPMEVLVDAESLKQAGESVKAESAGRLELKGFDEPVDVFRVLEVVSS